ncbi:MAG: hypothetical protein JEZ08_11945 [Clostridiales bacterium]|nr:hypothetical protein [Clostridiales bacterium]
MDSLNEYVLEYKNQLEKGDIKKAYIGLMEYIMSLRSHFKSKYPDYFVSGSVYSGYMDMSYFSFTPDFLKKRKLKIAIVFVHETIRFEVWLAGNNKQVQKKYWHLFRNGDFDKYEINSTLNGVDSIIEHILAENPNFDELTSLTDLIEDEALQFIKDLQNFLV